MRREITARRQPHMRHRSAEQTADVSPSTIASLVATGLQQVAVDMSSESNNAPANGPLAEFAHDLRSPLSTHLLLLERLRLGHAGPLTKEQDRQLQILHSAAAAMVAMANDAFDLARGPATSTAITLGTVAIPDLFDHIRAFVQPMVEERRLVLRLSSSATGRRVGDLRQVQRVLLNLVINALKYTEEGSVTVSAEDAGEDAPDGVTFVVSDSGQGLPAPVVEWLRDPRVVHPYGSGFGLPLCVQLLAGMGSALHHDDVAAGGTRLRFTVHLPRER